METLVSEGGRFPIVVRACPSDVVSPLALTPEAAVLLIHDIDSTPTGLK